MATRRDFLGRAASFLAGAGAGEVASRVGGDSEESKKVLHEGKLRAEGVLSHEVIEMAGLRERVETLLGSLKAILRNGIGEKQRMFDMDLGKLVQAASELRHKEINYRGEFLSMTEAVDASGSLVPKQEVTKVDDITLQCQNFLETLVQAHPAYAQDVDLHTIMSGDDQRKG